MNKAKLREIVAPSLPAFKKLAATNGYAVRLNPDARAAIQPFYVAEKAGEVMGTFSAKYPRQSFVLVK